MNTCEMRTDMYYVIKNKQSGKLFSGYVDNVGIWDDNNPDLFSRECDALWVVSQMGWYDVCEVVPWEE